MKLSDKQFEFAKMTTLLFQWLINNGYKFTLGDAYRKGDKRNHGKRLAIDINLFILRQHGSLSNYDLPEYKYTRKTEDHLPVGEFWESIGGSWGGRFSDGNHYSLEHNGVM
ncbi:MAG: M15 family metallopeptidase [bacterium]|nr:M15 family metallopeptidase [bacterium]